MFSTSRGIRVRRRPIPNAIPKGRQGHWCEPRAPDLTKPTSPAASGDSGWSDSRFIHEPYRRLRATGVVRRSAPAKSPANGPQFSRRLTRRIAVPCDKPPQAPIPIWSSPGRDMPAVAGSRARNLFAYYKNGGYKTLRPGTLHLAALWSAARFSPGSTSSPLKCHRVLPQTPAPPTTPATVSLGPQIHSPVPPASSSHLWAWTYRRNEA